MSSLQYDSAELGRGPRVVDFTDSSVSVRRADGSLLNIPISPYPAILHEYVITNKWSDAIKLCRLIQVSMKLDNIKIVLLAFAIINLLINKFVN